MHGGMGMGPMRLLCRHVLPYHSFFPQSSQESMPQEGLRAIQTISCADPCKASVSREYYIVTQSCGLRLNGIVCIHC